WYTSTFSGTSSASPIVTGAVAALQGAHKANFGFPLDADAIRTLLNATGTPQTGATSEHIGPRPNLQAAFDEALGVSLTVDQTFGPAPLAVQFTGASTKTVTSWLWDFGDGEFSSEQSPAHVYDVGGLFSVNLTVQTTVGEYSTTRPNFVAAAADTIDGLETSGAAGAQVKLDVYSYNSLPVIQYKIPLEYAGPLNLKLDSASVVGLRSSALNLALTSFNPFSRQATYTLTAAGGLASYLPGGAGPILSLFFTIPAGAPDDVNLAIMDGYGVEAPLVVTEWGSFSPVVDPGTISLDCVTAGDADGSGTINIGDVTFLIATIFSGGPLPDPLGRGDADCNSSVNIADVTYLLNWTFTSGPAPCACAP
ncbi:MAG TPA: PKD domain-containing protein, partial [candidate division Zixibacteria bacterium]|nr:PKD domain-containing protein [candidate division Zixibacteria bacterium]